MFNEDYRRGYNEGIKSVRRELLNEEKIDLRELAKKYGFKYDSVAEVFVSKNKYIEVSADGSKYQIFNNNEKRQYESEYFPLFAEDVVNADMLIKELNR